MINRLNQKKGNLTDKKGSLNSIKTPFLLEHTNRMEQKLSFLKQKISEQKKNKTKQTIRIDSIDKELSQFLSKIGMQTYTDKLIKNGIDSFQILKQIKQAELEEIGVSKGHALKIMIHLKKEQQNVKKEQAKTQRKQTERMMTQPQIKKAQIYDCQTQSYPIQNKLKLFCLFCYKKSQNNFCSSTCETHYERMFNKYEQNLRKAEQQFIPKPKEQSHEELQEQQIVHNFDFLFAEQKQQEFDEDEYNELLDIIKK